MSQFHEISTVHQILITEDGTLPARLPSAIQQNIDANKTAYPKAHHKLWSGNDITAFISRHFGASVLDAYRSLKPFSYRSDLARFCILLVEGGVYIDLGVRSFNQLAIPLTCGVAAFRDVAFISPSWSTIQTGLLWASPQRSEFEIAIGWIVDNCRTHYYGENSLYPTGPVLLGRAFVLAMARKGQSAAADDQRIGQCRCVTPEVPFINMTYVSKEGSVMALRTKALDGDLTHLGLTGVNNYNLIWRQRQVYGEAERVWTYDDPSIRLTEIATRDRASISVSEDMQGLVTYGPYVDLEPGSYMLRLSVGETVNRSAISVSVSANSGKDLLPCRRVSDTALSAVIETEFVIWNTCSTVEFLVRLSDPAALTIKRFALVRSDLQQWRADDPQIRIGKSHLRDDTLSLLPGIDGMLLYGPYVDLAPGFYCLDAYFPPGTFMQNGRVEITGNAGDVVVTSVAFSFSQSEAGCVIEIPFESDTPVSQAEFRLISSGEHDGSFCGYLLRKLTGPPRTTSSSMPSMLPSQNGRRFYQ